MATSCSWTSGPSPASTGCDQEPYVRAWAKAYRDDGLVVIGVHTPEFSFEHDVDRVRQAVGDRRIDYPVVIDNDYAVWNSFDNHYWPALYFVDRRRRHPRPALRRRDATRSRSASSSDCSAWSANSCPSRSRRRGGAPMESPALARDVPRLRAGRAVPVAAGVPSSTSPERTNRPSDCRRLLGAWSGTGRSGASGFCSIGRDGRIAFRFHARDAHLVLSRIDSVPIPFQVLLDGEAPGAAHGVGRRRGRQRSARRGPAVPARASAGRDQRTHARDHVLRTRRRGLRVHVRIEGEAANPVSRIVRLSRPAGSPGMRGPVLSYTFGTP